MQVMYLWICARLFTSEATRTGLIMGYLAGCVVFLPSLGAIVLLPPPSFHPSLPFPLGRSSTSSLGTDRLERSPWD
ncbi:hypothetical protein [Laspinema olomoucense]|nr:hypothetical protein [Laspinema sp. D3b]